VGSRTPGRPDEPGRDVVLLAGVRAEGEAIGADRPILDLLRGGDTVATGIALDHVQRSWASSRFGGGA
jgi:hypothetical protein